MALSILHQDDDYVAVDKPSGLVVHRGFSGDDDNVLSRLKRQVAGDLHPIHRLDRGTSGVLLLARHARAAREAGEAFAAGTVEKVYVALCRGSFEDAEVLVDAPVPKDEGGERVPAQTCIRSIASVAVASSSLREKRYSLVEAKPITGRFHQVRRHLKHLGHPIVGDTTYGRSEHNAFLREHVGLGRLALHCCELRVTLRGRVLDVGCALPEDLDGPFRALGLLRTWDAHVVGETAAEDVVADRGGTGLATTPRSSGGPSAQ